MSNNNHAHSSIVNIPGVLDFIQYAVSYCAFVEPQTTPDWNKESIIECRRLLAWVYATGLNLPDLVVDPFIHNNRVVTEREYDLVRKRIEHVLGEHDMFLNAQMEEMKYADTPVSVSTAEILADLYQVLADTVWIFRSQIEKNMYQAIAEVKFTLEHEWGTLLLAALRQLHDLHIDPSFVIDVDPFIQDSDE